MLWVSLCWFSLSRSSVLCTVFPLCVFPILCMASHTYEPFWRCAERRHHTHICESLKDSTQPHFPKYFSIDNTYSRMSNKRLYLVRHAESLQNVAVKRLTDQGEISALPSIIRIGHDAPLSPLGESQLLPANEFLKKHAWSPRAGARTPDLIVHSPHLRAKQTAQGIFKGCDSVPMIELHCLYERTAFEYLYVSPLDSRIKQANEWLRGRPEEVIVMVGHGQYFRRWLGLGYTQTNVHVMECGWSEAEGIRLLTPDPLILSLEENVQSGDFFRDRCTEEVGRK